MDTKVKDKIRSVMNVLTRKIIRDEHLRKRLVVRFYEAKVKSQNKSLSIPGADAVSILDADELLSCRYEMSHEVYRGNAYYGIGKSLLGYSNAEGPIKACVEHGVYFGRYVNHAELDESGLPALITFGPRRCEHVSRVSSVPVVPIGPYIAYAASLLGKESLLHIKGILGRTLLVFPSHSIDRVKVDYAVDAFVSEIDSFRANYGIDSTLVCLYYRDVENGIAEEYRKHGYRVVCAGYREDELFLSRLKSLILLSDYTMSNSVGTHVGYCAFLNRPHLIVPQEKQLIASTRADKAEFDNEFALSKIEEQLEVEAAFSSLSSEMDRERRRVCDIYWGFDCILTQEEMHDLVDILEIAQMNPVQLRQNEARKMLEDKGLIWSSDKNRKHRCS